VDSDRLAAFLPSIHSLSHDKTPRREEWTTCSCHWPQSTADAQFWQAVLFAPPSSENHCTLHWLAQSDTAAGAPRYPSRSPTPYNKARRRCVVELVGPICNVRIHLVRLVYSRARLVFSGTDITYAWRRSARSRPGIGCKASSTPG
jgi:hypothetical protein